MPESLHGLYVIIDPALTRGRDPAWIASEAIAGGARLIQWRDKTREKGLQLPDLQSVLTACQETNIPLIVNDHVDLALTVGADGIHVGQKDLPIAAVRRLVPADWIVGVSTNDVAEAVHAERDGASYIAVGNLFGSQSKADTRPATLETVREVKAAVSVPVCAIGGINASNIEGVIAVGADMAAVISAVCGAEEPRQAARAMAKWSR
ncbi:MAG: thiamine phosphate synthase [Dehalococcoidia bacterium]